MKEFHITSDNKLAEALNTVAELPVNGRYEVIIKKTAKDRTYLQNRSLHLYLRMMALKFNEAGIDQRATWEHFKSGFNIPVTEHFLKEIFQSISYDMVGVAHTSKLTTVQMQQVYEAFDMGMNIKFNISLPWPSRLRKAD